MEPVASKVLFSAFSDNTIEKVVENSRIISKQLLKDALAYSEELLRINNLVADNASGNITEVAKKIGEKIATSIMEILDEHELIEEEDLIEQNEEHFDKLYEEIITDESDADEWYEPETKKRKETDLVPLDAKIKSVIFAQEHPNWSLQSLQSKTTRLLKKKEYIERWKQQILTGGTKFEKLKIIDDYTYNHFKDARAQLQQVTTRDLQQWALSIASQYQSESFQFKASLTWVTKFKQKHRIRQRKITKYVSKKEIASVEETLQAAEKFRKMIRCIIPQFSPDFIINTD